MRKKAKLACAFFVIVCIALAFAVTMRYKQNMGVLTAVSQPLVMRYEQEAPEPVKMLSQLKANVFSGYCCVDGWYGNEYFGPMTLEDVGVVQHGIGLLSDNSSEESVVNIAYRLDGAYSSLRFHLGCDSEWNNGNEKRYGTFCLTVIDRDGNRLYESDWQDGSYTQDVTISLKGVKRITFLLNLKPGSRGALPVVLGDPALS